MKESELGGFLGDLLLRLPMAGERADPDDVVAVLADLITRLRAEEADAHDARQSFFNGPRRS